MKQFSDSAYRSQPMIRGIISVSLSQLFLKCSEHFPPFVWFIRAGENANVQAQNYVTETCKTESFSPDKMTETHVDVMRGKLVSVFENTPQ